MRFCSALLLVVVLSVSACAPKHGHGDKECCAKGGGAAPDCGCKKSESEGGSCSGSSVADPGCGKAGCCKGKLNVGVNE
jgi:hypothetical protein